MFLKTEKKRQILPICTYEFKIFFRIYFKIHLNNYKLSLLRNILLILIGITGYFEIFLRNSPQPLRVVFLIPSWMKCIVQLSLWAVTSWIHASENSTFQYWPMDPLTVSIISKYLFFPNIRFSRI